MTTEQLRQEKRYLLCLSLLHSMHTAGLLDEAEYKLYRTLLLEKYKPSIASIFD